MQTSNPLFLLSSRPQNTHSGFNARRKQVSDIPITHCLETLFLARPEGFEPPTTWFVASMAVITD
jgi:hypothetical protein